MALVFSAVLYFATTYCKWIPDDPSLFYFFKQQSSQKPFTSCVNDTEPILVSVGSVCSGYVVCALSS